MRRSLRVALVTGVFVMSSCGSQPAAADIGTGYRKGVVVQEGPRKPRKPRMPVVRVAGVRSAPQVREKAAGRIARPVIKPAAKKVTAKKVAVSSPSWAGKRAPYNQTGYVNGFPCGGKLPTCRVLQCESKGNPRAENPRSSASGLWQVIDGTWGGYGGYSRASSAPASVQNDHAVGLWAGGRGRSHWRSCL